MLRFHRFHVPAAAVRPRTTDTCFLFPFSYARGRYALIGRSSYHVTPEVSASRDQACLLVCFPFPSHVTFTVLV